VDERIILVQFLEGAQHMTQPNKQHIHERLGMSVEEALNRLIWFGQISHKYKEEFGETMNPKHLEAVLNATPPKEKSND
jgi:hypothetical protein